MGVHVVTMEYVPFFWASFRVVCASPFASVVAVADWLPRTKLIILLASGLPWESYRTALSVMVLFGPPVSEPV